MHPLPQNVQFYCVVPPVVAHLIKPASLGILKCIAQTKLKATPAAFTAAAYAIGAALLLVLCSAAVVLLSSFGFALCSDCADSPQFYLWYQL